MEKNIPDFFEEILNAQYGKELSKDIIYNLNLPKKVTLRVNTIKSDVNEIISVFEKENIKFKNIKWYKDAFIIENVKEERLKELDIYKQGKIYLQSLSSMLPPLVLSPNEKENILDMAAAPGGKTTQMATLSDNKAYITACERNKIRGEKLKYNLEKQGAKTVNVMLEDAGDLSDFFSFDKILLDAPCSGSGTDNVFKSNFTYSLIEKSKKTQERLLRKALKILKSGGEMVYSTCSILSKENEEVVEKVIKEFKAELINIDLSDEIKCLPCNLKEAKVIAPNELFEGFFVAKIRKK
jgi:NOL1/NOP2/sun family putative RNA methylase